MQHAYLIIAHNEFEVLQLLVSALDDVCNDIYVHIDRKVKTLPSLSTSKSRLYMLDKRIDVRWGHVSQIKTELLLFETALANGPYDFYHLISGTHLPLKSQDEIKDFFEQRRGCEIMNIYQPTEWQIDLKLRRYHFFIRNYQSSHRVRRSLSQYFWRANMAVQKLFGIRHNTGCDFVKSDNWLSLTEKAVSYLVTHKKSIFKKYRFSFCGDEYFAGSELSEAGEYKILNENKLLYTVFGNANPKTLTVEDYDDMVGSDCLFARKFSINEKEIIKRMSWINLQTEC